MKIIFLWSIITILSINLLAQEQDSVFVRSCVTGRLSYVAKSEAISSDLIDYNSKKLFRELGAFHQVMGCISIAACVVGVIALSREKSISPYFYIPNVAVGLLGVWEFSIGRDLRKYSGQ